MTQQSGARERGLDFQHTLHALRCAGWTVAVHNDYRLAGEPKTFWLLTHPNGRYVKGEGVTDMDALMECDAAVRALSVPPCVEAAGGRVPDGWKLVPVEPVFEMVSAAYSDQPGAINTGFAQAYRAMLSAAPTPPAETGG